VIVSYVQEWPEPGYFMIESFDVTVTYSLKVIQDKLNNAQPLFKDALQS
jgi:hypothetical protein